MRELENFIERAVILSQGEVLEVPVAELKACSLPHIASPSTFEEAQRTVIMDALKATSGRVAGKGGAAERLGVKRTTLLNKMRRLNISPGDFSQVSYSPGIAQLNRGAVTSPGDS